MNRAGENIRNNSATPRDLEVLEEWRAAHRAVLNTFQAILRERARGQGITVAQRHKRKRTVFDKLLRLPSMKLSRMDDVAGCRVIFKNAKALNAFRSEFHSARFKHKLRNAEDIDKYDYIKRPKTTGYRGIHDIYEYDVNSEVGKPLTGLLVEIQYRTMVQHAWATAVEVIGLISESQPKFQQGNVRLVHAMAVASEILARAHEGTGGPFPEKQNRELVDEFVLLNGEVHLLEMLRELHASNRKVSTKKNVILMYVDGHPLEVKSYRDATDAMRALFDLENKFPERDIVLVRADTGEEVRLAFNNYFSDARAFIRLINSGCQKLWSTRWVPATGGPIAPPYPATSTSPLSP